MTRVVLTEHGFQFGAMTVEATTSIRRRENEGPHTVITIRTEAGVELSVYCSPTGRSLRVFRRGKGEMKLL